MNCELPNVQAGFRKGKGTRDHIANIRWIIEKAKEFQKNIIFCFIDYAKAFDCVDHNKLSHLAALITSHYSYSIRSVALVSSVERSLASILFCF